MKAAKRTSRVLERGITWRPHHDSHHVLAAMFASARLVAPLCVTQRALVAVEEHLCRPGAPCQYGLLLGQLCVHPETREPYVLIDGTLDCPPPKDWWDLHVQIATELSGRIAAATRARHVVIGYYRGAAVVVPRPSPADIALFQALFPEPWQVMLVRDVQSDGGTGAFVRVEPIHGRPYAAPFVELLPRECRARRAPPSALTWRNYDPAEPVTRMAALADGAASPGSRRPSGSLMPRPILEVVRGLAGRQGPAPGSSSPRAAGHSPSAPLQRHATDERVADVAVPGRVVPSADLHQPSAVFHSVLEPWPPHGCTDPPLHGRAARTVPLETGMLPPAAANQPSPPTPFPSRSMSVASPAGARAPPVAEALPALGCCRIVPSRATAEPRTPSWLTASMLDAAVSADARTLSPVREPWHAPRPMLADVATLPRSDRAGAPTPAVGAPADVPLTDSAVPHAEQRRPAASPPFVAPVASFGTAASAVVERSSSPPRRGMALDERDVHPAAGRRDVGSPSGAASVTGSARAVPRSTLPILLPLDEPDTDPQARGASRLVVAAIAVLLALVAAASAWLA